MKLRTTIALATLAITLSVGGGSAIAQEHQDHNDQHDQHSDYVRHDEWKKGNKINQQDWQRGQQVDYKQHHLQAPPRGYEWRQVDGNYVLAAAATGLIASAILASGH